MKNELLFEFTVDKPNKTVFVNREFPAGLSLLWDAFTKKELLDQWWAPKPWMSKTKTMEFKVGGKRVYAMVGPEGQEHWSIQEFTSISPKTNFKFLSSFSDENANILADWPSSRWSLDFTENDGVTRVSITINHQSLADLEKLIEMGFQGGFTMTLDYLAEMLKGIA